VLNLRGLGEGYARIFAGLCPVMIQLLSVGGQKAPGNAMEGGGEATIFL